MDRYLVVLAGAGIGGLARYVAGAWIMAKYGGRFPLGTLVINVTGSFIIGIAGALAVPEGRMDSQTRQFVTQFLMVGICGGYTTFSSFSLQTLNLLREREWLYAGGNIVVSVVVCMIGVWLGWMLGSTFNSAK